ncbi:MAG TPA: MFS transporter [Polyangiaceae bacterium]|nr:MFS transporter [Polyangiaceae bacterium]
MQERLVTRNFVLLVVAHFLQALGYASMLLLPLYLQHLGASRTEIGAIMATAAISGLLTRPLVAWGLDTLGRKPTLVAGTLTLVVGMLMIASVDRIGPMIYLARMVIGAGVGVLFAAYFTYAADLVPISRRTEGLALFGISGLLPLLINPFADRLGVAAPDLRWFLPAVGGVISLSLGALALLPEPQRVAVEGQRMRDAIVALRKRPLWPVWFATVMFSALVSVFGTFATVAAERRGVTEAPSMWLSYALGAVGVRLFGSRVPDRIGPSNLVAPALGSYVIALLIAAGADSFGDFLLAALAAGIGHGYCFPVLAGQVVSRSPESFRGSALALFTGLWIAAELLGSPAFGAVADRLGDGAMFIAAAASGIVSLAFWSLLEHRHGVARSPAQ